MKPYYDHAGITIYHGDCREVMPSLAVADLVLTDSPYGIAEVWKGGASSGWSKARSATPARNAWDEKPPDTGTLKLLLSKGREAVIWGGNYFDLPKSRGWLVWTKPERDFTLSEAELAWTSRDTVIRIFDGPRSEPDRIHPTQKPLCLMAWCLERFDPSRTVLDPYMGSGTTLRAAKDRGLEAVGVEIDERYCEIAAKRLSQEVLPFEVSA